MLFRHFVHIALAASVGFPLPSQAEQGAATASPVPSMIDCARPYPDSVSAAINEAAIRHDAAHARRLEEMLSSLSIDPVGPLASADAQAVFDRLAALTSEGFMITSEIVHLDALETLPAWRESAQAGLFTRMLQTIYEPYHPDESEKPASFPSRVSAIADEMNEADAAFNDALTTARNQVVSAIRRVPGFFDRPVRWFIQGVIYNDPVARQYAAGRLCADDALRARVPAINQEVAKIEAESLE